jgi:hypothetical protein
MTSQTEFHTALLNAAIPVPEGLLDGDGRPAGSRYAVYRNNVAVSLSEALETGFPAVAKLIGPENFSKAAGIYLRAHPPTSPMLMLYGKGFADFLAGLEPLKSIGYLGDVARLEYAMRESYHAADAPAFDPSRLQDMDDEELNATRFVLAPASRLVTSPWPVLAVYNFTLIEGSPAPEAIAQNVLITRPEYDPIPHELPQGAAEFIAALGKGQTFGEALRAAGRGFDLTNTISLLLGSGAVTDIKKDMP